MPLPESVGRLRVLRLIGTGGFASVWLAHDPVLDSTVALKVLADNWSQRSDVRERFMTEARLLRRVDSDAVVRVYDIGELPDGRPWLAMTHADRGSLADRLPWQSGPQSALALLRDLASAVDSLHQHGIVHRDLAPGNILFASGRPHGDPHHGDHHLDDQHPSERVLLGDLGLAKDLGFASGLTQPGGTGPYRAPEQLEVSDRVGPATDVYALSVLAAELLGPHLTPAQQAVIEWARRHDPAHRPQSATRLIHELHSAEAQTTTAATQVPRTQLDLPPPPSSSAATGTRARRRPRRRLLIVGAVCAAGVIVAPLAGWYLLRADSTVLQTPDGTLSMTVDGRGWEVAEESAPDAGSSSAVTARRDGATVALVASSEGAPASPGGPSPTDCDTWDVELAHWGAWSGSAIVASGCGTPAQDTAVSLEHPRHGAVHIRLMGADVPDLAAIYPRLELPA